MKAFKDQSPSIKEENDSVETNSIKVEDGKEKIDVVPGVVTSIVSPDKKTNIPSKRLAETIKERPPSESAQSKESSLSPPPSPPPQTRRSTRSSRKKKKVNFSKDSDSEID